MTPEISDFHAFAHDLRHYLRQAITQSQLALRRSESGDPTQLRTSLETIVRSGLACDELIKAMVQYMEADSASASRTWPLSRAIQALPLEMKALIEASGTKLEIECPAADILIPQSLQGVWRELVANSIKFRRFDGDSHILLQVEWQPERLDFRVLDTGIGIPPEYLETVFLPFRRLHPREAYVGFGLGLARCRRILRNLHGDLMAIDSPRGAALHGWLKLG